jgi:hypothetical protein
MVKGVGFDKVDQTHEISRGNKELVEARFSLNESGNISCFHSGL